MFHIIILVGYIVARSDNSRMSLSLLKVFNKGVEGRLKCGNWPSRPVIFHMILRNWFYLNLKEKICGEKSDI